MGVKYLLPDLPLVSVKSTVADGMTTQPAAQQRFLCGKRVVLTRALHQSHEWQIALTRLGAHVVLYPVLTIEPPQPQAPLTQAITQALAGQFSWIVFSSANAVCAVQQQLVALGDHAQLPTCVQLAAVGDATAKSIQQQLSRTADFIAPYPSGQCLGQTLPLQQGQAVLLPQAQGAHPGLQQLLQQRACHVCAVTAYRSVPHCPPQHPATVFCCAPGPCIVCFASGLSVTACLAALQRHDALSLLDSCMIACVGHGSLRVASQRGLSVDIACVHASLESLVHTLQDRFG